MKTIVLGLGNPVLSDDGVGWHVLAALRPCLIGRSDVRVEECCRGGLELMERMVGYDRAVIIDAIRTGARPGTIHLLSVTDIPTQHSASGHDANLRTALTLGRRTGARLPADRRVRLVAVEAQDTETFCEACTPAVAAAIPAAAAAVESALEFKEEPTWR